MEIRLKYILILFVLFSISCFSQIKKEQLPYAVKINETIIFVEIASSAEEWKKGLMFRKKLEVNKGMLFISKNEKIRNFWMKNTYISLDIIFISANKKIVGVIENTTPLSKKLIKIKKPSQYVLEVKAGVVKKAKLKIGDTIEFKTP